MLVVQRDFDDTVSVGNVSTAIRQEFGPEEWVAMEREYHSGAYSVEESNIRQFALVNETEERIAEFVTSTVKVRDGFAEFVRYCRREGLKLVVVSSGLDLYINPVMDQLGFDHLEIRSGKATFASDGIHVEYRDPSGAATTRGFKESSLRHFKEQGCTVIYVGDGLSDIVPASEADFVIARSTLEEYFKSRNLSHFRFDTFAEVVRHVEEIRKQI